MTRRTLLASAVIPFLPRESGYYLLLPDGKPPIRLYPTDRTITSWHGHPIQVSFQPLYNMWRAVLNSTGPCPDKLPDWAISRAYLASGWGATQQEAKDALLGYLHRIFKRLRRGIGKGARHLIF